MDKRFLYLMNQAHKNLFKVADENARRATGISATQMTALFYLMENDGCLLKELAQGLHMNNSAVSGLADRMEKQGLLTRKANSRDGRSFKIFLTDKAKLLLPDSFKMLKAFNNTITSDFSHEEQEVILRFLHHLMHLPSTKADK